VLTLFILRIFEKLSIVQIHKTYVITHAVHSYIQYKAIPVQGYYKPTGFQEVEAPRFLEIGT
jgi:hypothetical protein